MRTGSESRSPGVALGSRSKSARRQRVSKAPSPKPRRPGLCRQRLPERRDGPSTQKTLPWFDSAADICTVKLTAHQPNYLPYPGFFQKIAAADHFLIVDTTQFVKRGPFGWIHRNRIRTPNGPIWLSLPVIHKGRYHQTIRDTELNSKVNWRGKHWKSIEFNYRKSPHWDRFSPSLREIYERDWTHLAPLSTALIRWFMNALELERPVTMASDLAAKGQSTDYIVSFCQELGATQFLSGVHGRDYLDTPQFDSAGIELLFQSYAPPEYLADGRELDEDVQFTLLDMLFWCGDEATKWVHHAPEVVTG